MKPTKVKQILKMAKRVGYWRKNKILKTAKFPSADETRELRNDFCEGTFKARTLERVLRIGELAKY